MKCILAKDKMIMMTERESLPKSAIVPASDYVIIGGTGDLSLRKIFPALFLRYVAGQVTNNFRLFVVGRQEIDANEFRKKLEPHLAPSISGVDGDVGLMDRFMNLVEFTCVDITQPMSMMALAEILLPEESEGRPIVFYLSIAPSLFSDACQRIHEAGLVMPQSRLVVEKPLGHDRASSREINDELLAAFKEDQIYRIDHYLGKETVQNLMALRFANVIFEALWNNRYIDNIQITVAETLGVGSRAAYYDNYGAIRDMLQNHLLQLLCLVAMEPPARFNAEQVRNEKLRVLQALRPVNAENCVLVQYQEYPHEVGASTSTETYVALKVLIDNWRWAGVPFISGLGKSSKPAPQKLLLHSKIDPMISLLVMMLQIKRSRSPIASSSGYNHMKGLGLLTSKEPGRRYAAISL